MSSILDALKKSEAERQRGTPPTLDSPIVFQRRPAAPKRRQLWILPVLAVAALAGAWYAGLLSWPAPTTAPEPPAGVVADGDAASPDAADAVGAAPDPAAIAAVPPPVEVPAAPPAEPAPEPTPDLAAPPAGPSRGFYAGGARVAAPDPPAADAGAAAVPARDPAAQAAAAIPPPVVAPPVPPVDAQLAPAEPQPAPPSVPADPAVAPLTPAPDPAAAPFTPAPDPAAPAAADAGIPSIHDLPFAVRRELPELKVTMHLYSPDPARRLVLLNGVRARDGDTLAGGLEVVAIRATDIVLRFQGTEFVLPLRG